MEAKDKSASRMEGENERAIEIPKKQNNFIEESINKIKSGRFGRNQKS